VVEARGAKAGTCTEQCDGVDWTHIATEWTGDNDLFTRLLAFTPARALRQALGACVLSAAGQLDHVSGTIVFTERVHTY